MNATMRKTTLLFLSFLMLVLASGCVYRADISQGNVFDQEDLDQTKIGMTKSQVRFLLGTPMIDDPFTRDRWDYVYYLKLPREEARQKGWISIFFVDGKVTEIRTDQYLSPDL